MKLPKIGPKNTKSFFEEYLYALLAIVFFALTILGKAGGFSGYNAVVIGAWVTAMVWCAHQWKDYFFEKSKAENGKTAAPRPLARSEAVKGALPLPPGMKPIIGVQWPVKPGARPSWPKLPKELSATAEQKEEIQPPVATPNQAQQTNSHEKKRAFVYERPTLPDRTPKLPNNWVDENGKNQRDRKRDHRKPKR